ncbi:hypothetical protein GGR51DRAFT_488531 [Nemania sp. FL0031]|nr:hypothetical protein GGR51DRAFT_488531 [Nemania sp. FL0031]
MATLDEQRQRRRAEAERIMRNYDKKGRPVRYYSHKVGIAIFKYAIMYPIWGVLWVFAMFCFTGRRPFSHGWCGTGRMQAERRKRVNARVKSNFPRPLYRHKPKNHDPKSEGRYVIDEAALKRRRRLSFGADDQGQPQKLKGLLRRAKRTVLLGLGGTKPPLERSRLLELPAEIRALIWKYALGNRTIHLFYGEPVRRQPFVFPLKASLFPVRIRRVGRGGKVFRRLSCVECVHREIPTGWEDRHPLHDSCPDCGVLWNAFGECTGKVQWGNIPGALWSTSPSAKEMVSVVAVEREWKPLALLSTCRQIYKEAIDLLYSDNIFHFPLPNESHFSFPSIYPNPIQDFSNTILVQRFNRITRVSTTAFINSQLFGGLSDVLSQHLPGVHYLEIQAMMLHVRGLTVPDITGLLKLVREMRNRVPGVEVILRADLDSNVLAMLVNIELPEGVQVITVPNEVWERRATIFEGSHNIGHHNISPV